MVAPRRDRGVLRGGLTPPDQERPRRGRKQGVHLERAETTTWRASGQARLRRGRTLRHDATQPSRHGPENAGLPVKQRAPSGRNDGPARFRRLGLGQSGSVLLVAAVALVAFARVVGFGFVYDDGWTLVDNAWLSRPLPELVAL